MFLFEKYLSGKLTAKFYTLGCKVNQYESQAMAEILEKENIHIITDGTPDIIVINSCTVTGESDNKTRKLLRRCRRDNPNSIIILAGCYPQAYPDIADSLPQADIIIGTKGKNQIVKYLTEYLQTGKRIIKISEHKADDNFENTSINTFHERTRAFIKIEDGCNNYCTYCIIPTARGRIRSKPIDILKNELIDIAKSGYKEIVLVGINLTAYGKDTGLNICDAVEAACSVEGIQRVRLGSIEPDKLNIDIIQRLSRQSKLCPHFHLSLQSGCDEILRSMNRHYSSEEYAKVVNNLRQYFPDCSITTDIMVGFPGETDEYFQQSIEFAKSINFTKVHVFSYSPRPGTKAALMQQIDKHIKDERNHIMQNEMNKCRLNIMKSLINKEVNIVLEQPIDGMYEGYTPEYIPVRVDSKNIKTGQSVNVKITYANIDYCTGRLI